jgi:hypothetical protein
LSACLPSNFAAITSVSLITLKSNSYPSFSNPCCKFTWHFSPNFYGVPLQLSSSYSRCFFTTLSHSNSLKPSASANPPRTQTFNRFYNCICTLPHSLRKSFIKTRNKHIVTSFRTNSLDASNKERRGNEQF